MLSEKTIAYGNRAATGLLGVDRLYRAENKNDEDGLVVLNMDTEGQYQPEPFESYTAAKEYFAALKSEAEDLEEADRRLYYDQLCASTLAFIAWREGSLPFTEQLSGFLHVPPEPASDAELDGIRSEIRTLLTQMGYSGDLAAQCSAWQDRNQVPPDEVKEVLQSLLDEAWDRTEEYLLEIPAPKSDGMKAMTVSGVPYNGRINYLDRQVELNIDPVLTRPGLKHLAVHEGTPGHYLQFKLREVWHNEGKAPADGLLSVVNTASSSPFEGIADTGLKMIQWIETDDDRVSALMGRYRSGIGTAAAWRLNALNWPKEKVSDWLYSQSLGGGEGWVKNRMGFISSPARAVLIWSYWWGEKSVSPAWESVPQGQQVEFLRFLYGRMHSPQSVAMFGVD
jgi:hypothetical protein